MMEFLRTLFLPGHEPEVLSLQQEATDAARWRMLVEMQRAKLRAKKLEIINPQHCPFQVVTDGQNRTPCMLDDHHTSGDV